MNEARETDGSGPPANGEKDGAFVAGKYEVLEELAVGDGSTAYKVRHAVLGPTLFVTVLPASLTRDPGQVERFREAVQRASRLRHDNIAQVIDNIAQVIDFGQEAGRCHVVEAFVDGASLDRILRGGNPLGSTEALQVAHQLAEALRYAHEGGVVHGAISPASVRVRRTNPPRATLCGFAAAVGDSAPSAARVPYSAPERLTGQPADVRSDIFALGLLIYEMFEGKRLLSGGETEIRSLLLEGNGPLLPRFSRIAPAGVPALVARMIRRAPAERPQSMAQVRSEIEACLMRLGEIDSDGGREASDGAPARRRTVIVVDDALREEEDETDRDLATGEPARPVMMRPAVQASVAARRPFSIARALMVAALGLALAWPFLRGDGREPPAPAPASVAPQPVAAPPVEVPPPPTAMPEVQPEPPEETALAVATPAAPPATAIADSGGSPREGARPENAARTSPRPTLAPRIASYWPGRRENVRVIEGGAVNFGVRAAIGNGGGRLAYAWSLDGRRVGRERAWRFVAPPPVSTAPHTVAVRVSRGAGKEASLVSWQVEVTPRMSDVDVRDWLDRLASALERKDVPTLRLYGIVTSEAEAELVRRELPRTAYRVGIANEAISTHGQFATVAFDRALLDERGKPLSARREAYELEKHPGGFVALRDR